MMFIIRLLALLTLLSLLGACASTSEKQAKDTEKLAALKELTPTSDLHCDRYIVYDMCGQDLDHDGDVDFLYFDDTKEVFMYMEEVEGLIPEHLTLHRCAQVGDVDLQGSASEFLYVSEETGFFHMQKIKADLFFDLMRFSRSARKCYNATADGAGAYGVDPEAEEGYDF